MQFSTVASVAAIAAVASAAANVTTSTAHKGSTTLVTITSCEDHVCSETVSPALVSTATVTVSDVVTQYTTWCPLETTTAAPESHANTTTATTQTGETTSHEITSSYTGGAAAKALPAAGALFAGAAALLL